MKTGDIIDTSKFFQDLAPSPNKNSTFLIGPNRGLLQNGRQVAWLVNNKVIICVDKLDSPYEVDGTEYADPIDYIVAKAISQYSELIQ